MLQNRDNHVQGSIKKMLSKYFVLLGFIMSSTREHIYLLKVAMGGLVVCLTWRSCEGLVNVVIVREKHYSMVMNASHCRVIK